MGKTIEPVDVKNFIDIAKVAEGALSEANIRTQEVKAVVDTEASFLCLPPTVIAKLGLLYSHSRAATTTNGNVMRRIFNGAVIIVQGRDIQMQVMENDENRPSLLGYLILENMDFVVDPRSQRVIPNPEHDGKWVMDLY